MNLTALADQVGAAARDARERWAAALQPLAGPDLPPDSIGAHRVRAGLVAAVTGLATGSARLCAHLDLTRPRPCIWSAWDPGLIHCGSPVCASPLGTSEAHTCDSCHRYAPSSLLPVSCPIGIFIVCAGLCARCRAPRATATENQKEGTPCP